MKNRIILNAKGIPILPQSNGIAEKVAETDVRDVMRKLAFEAYEQGTSVALSCLRDVFVKTKAQGHESITLDECLQLVEELEKICKANIPK